MKQLLSICGLILSCSVGVAEDRVIDFTRDVRPILSGRCFTCHGPDAETREAGLRLDDSEAARLELESGETAIVPGAPDKSELMARVLTDDEFTRMPPPDKGPKLTDTEVNILKQWIKQGAHYAQHWSFVPPVSHPLPKVTTPQWCQNEIDFFVKQKLDAAGLAPSRPADRATLIRRVTLDLTGLPPTPAEVAQFVSDASPDAYVRLVDRLLASPAFGERWGRIWLDLARYADSAGYADDPPRVIWKYRDWVVEAVNSGMPFDQFTVEQLAGDLLTEPTNDQLIATGFHRNTMTNSEGGTDDEEFRTAAVVDRVNTSLQVWMGLTMGCAQCHTHKYDPITQEEYFKVYAIFNQTEDADRRNEAPLLSMLSDEQKAVQSELTQQIAEAKKSLSQLEAEIAQQKPNNSLPTGELAGQYLRVELPGKKEFLSLAEVQVFADEENVALQGKAKQSSTGYNAGAELAIDGNTDGHFFDAKSTTHTEQQTDPWWEVDLGNQQRVDRVVIWNRNDSPEIGTRLNGVRVVLLNQDRKVVWATRIDAPTSKENPLTIPRTAAEFSKIEKTEFANYKDAEHPELAKQKQAIKALEKQLAAIQPITTPIMRELPHEKQRKTHIQIRGNFLDLGPEVSAGFPNSFHSPPSDNANRLEFAKWLIADNNPLTARVIANRHWEVLFGIGIVETSEDFGMQGELPTHPELLDQLAIRLMETGWDTKRLIRDIVMSSTYQQDSSVSPELVAQDPKNRLLARGPRFRLSAEMIRDQALSLAGLLSDKMEGPSVQPPRPKLGLRAAFGGSTDWETSKGEDKYRRGVYTEWRRSTPYPSMDTFDAPSREVCTLRRIRTNTPLQALVTLNDPVFIEAAQGLAGRLIREGGETPADRLQYGFQLCTNRLPTEREQSVLLNAFTEATLRYQQQLDEAQLLKATGLESESVPVPEQAAWTVMANILLNLDETLTRR